MRDREDLCCLRVRTVHEDHRSERIGQRKATELPRVQDPMRVTPNNAAHHHHHADPFRCIDEKPQRVGPIRAAFVNVEAQCRPHLRTDRRRIVAHPRGTDERDRVPTLNTDVVPVPLLALLTHVDRVEQISARPSQRRVANRAEIRQRDRLNRRFREQQHADRRVRCRSEILRLLQRRRQLTALPRPDLRETLLQTVTRNTRPIDRPRQHSRLNRNAHPHPTSLPQVAPTDPTSANGRVSRPRVSVRSPASGWAGGGAAQKAANVGVPAAHNRC